MPVPGDFRSRVARLKAETIALYFAARHPKTPWYAKLLVAGIVAYALSPIDLVPDFVPVVGLLDDLIMISAGMALAIRMIPAPVLAECRARASEIPPDGVSGGRAAAVVIVALWLVLAAWCLAWVYEAFA
jgi:uncharacterized membrane protein YkvA (DUF1232 family)